MALSGNETETDVEIWYCRSFDANVKIFGKNDTINIMGLSGYKGKRLQR